MKKKRIMIVEDESVTGLSLKALLEDAGYTIAGNKAYSSGETALKSVKKLHPDLILMDIILKGKLDGISAMKQIQRELDVPFIYLTAYADKETMDRAQSTRPLGYIVKPFSRRDLLEHIELAFYKHEQEKQLKK